MAGNAYSTGAPPLPRSLEEAASALRHSETARELFGRELVEHFAELEGLGGAPLPPGSHGLGAAPLFRGDLKLWRTETSISPPA